MYLLHTCLPCRGEGVSWRRAAFAPRGGLSSLRPATVDSHALLREAVRLLPPMGFCPPHWHLSWRNCGSSPRLLSARTFGGLKLGVNTEDRQVWGQ